MTPTTATQATVHTLKVTLTGVRPAVWRRVEVPSSITLGQLSEVLNLAFGWSDQGLHQFDVRGVCYVSGDARKPHEGAWSLARGFRDDDVVRLSSVATHAGEQFDYIYPYGTGDEWRHRVVVEKVDTVVPDRWYPACRAGAGLAPEESTGLRRPGRFDDEARARLAHELRGAALASRGRDLPAPGTPEGVLDAVFDDLFPSLAEDACHECPCGCGAVDERLSAGPFPVHYPASVDMLADLAAESPLVRRAVALARWVGGARHLTASGVLRPADALRAVDELRLADPVLHLPGPDPLGLGAGERHHGVRGHTGGRFPGGRFPGGRRADGAGTVRSARDLPALHPLWTAAVAAGLIDVRGARACPGPALAVWDGPSEPAQRVDAWARLLVAYLRARSEASRAFAAHPFGPVGDVLSASVPLFYAMGAREPVTVGMIALSLADQNTEDDEPPPLWLIPSLVAGAAEAAEDWMIAGVLGVVPPPVTSVPPPQGVLGVVGAGGTVLAAGSASVPRVEVEGSVAHFRGVLADLHHDLTGAMLDDVFPVQDDAVSQYARAHVDAVVSALAAGPLLMVSPLGAHGLARLLRAHGWWVPESGDCVSAAPGELLDRLLPYVPEDAVVEAGAWIAARGDHWESAVQEVARSAAVPGPEGPGRRAALPAVLCAAGPRVAPLLDLWHGDSWLSAVAASTGEALGVGPCLTLRQRLWLAVDATSAAMGSREAVRELVAASDLLDLLRVPGAVATAVALDHPAALDVLNHSVPHLDDRDVARALRRALAARSGGRRSIRPGQPLLRLVVGTAGDHEPGHRR